MNGNKFTDSSSNALTFSAIGTPSIQSFSPFPPSASYSANSVAGSVYFNGSSDYLTMPSGTSSLYMSGAFTWETWFYPISSSGNLYGSQVNGVTGNNDFSFYYNNAGGSYGYKIAIYRGAYGYYAGFKGSTTSVPLNQWNHLAIVRDLSNTWYFFLNGVSLSLASAQSWDDGASFSDPGAIGVGGTSSYKSFNGYISNMRLVTGSALYTSNFTPSTSPLTAVSGTQLLVKGSNGAIFDQTSNNNLYAAGSAQISTAQSKFGDSSMLFNGSTDYIRSTNSFNTDFGTGDFTVEFWMNASASGTYVAVVGTQSISGNSTSGMWRVSIRLNSVNGIYFNYTTGSAFVDVTFTTTNYNDNTWHHVAVSRSSGSVRAFVDGTQVGSTTSITQNLTSGQKLNVGYQAQDGVYYNGYIDDLRITRYARYTSNFTPPSSAFQNK